ncbi:MAG: hypothetical protein B6D47_06960 [Rhodocyclaceae bacterium UTPRO2]|nr:MAG: hypothetical protein B6D47_06960 [Rhodocyclaceae bacterium UTPRO2]
MQGQPGRNGFGMTDSCTAPALAQCRHRQPDRENAMRKAIVILALPLFTAPALADGMKAGLWEIKTLKQVMDGRDMKAQMDAAQAQMQQQMASLPPDQRKQMEAMLRQQGVSAGQGAMRICISPEAARREEPMLDPEGRCKPTKMSRSGSTTRFEFDCTSNGHRSVGKGESTFSGNTIHTRMDMTTMDATGRHTMQTESQMNYLGPDCKGLAPVGAPRR